MVWEATALNGGTLTFTIDSKSTGVYVGTSPVGTAMVTVADIVTDNGVVHVIDAVLVPETPSSVFEVEDSRVYDNFFYNIMGQRYESLNDIPFGTLYISNGRKYIRTEN